VPRVSLIALAIASAAVVVSAERAPELGATRLTALETALAQHPDSLRLGAEYRQLIIATAGYDRAIKMFDRLSKDPRGGANRFVNLALAYVDKVPVAGTIRQAMLGRDAINAATHAIEIEPDPLPYLIRGTVNLYYDRAIFHRTDKGIADLEQARALAAHDPQFPLERVLVTLGDGYWRFNQPAKAREIWREGLTRYPSSERLQQRLDCASERALNDIVERALDAAVRVDTTLHEWFPDVPLASKTPLP